MQPQGTHPQEEEIRNGKQGVYTSILAEALYVTHLVLLISAKYIYPHFKLTLIKDEANNKGR